MNLWLRLSQLYLDSNRIDECIRVLKNVLAAPLRADKASGIQVLLAKVGHSCSHADHEGGRWIKMKRKRKEKNEDDDYSLYSL